MVETVLFYLLSKTKDKLQAKYLYLPALDRVYT
jgi:hypothetical protein